jgi:hypothetical protein
MGKTMKTTKIFIPFLLLFTIALSSSRAQVALTIYNNDLCLVREQRPIEVQKGIQTIRFEDVAARIDPTSVHFKSLTDPEGVVLLEQNFEYDLVGTDRLLEKYINQSLVVTSKEGNVFSGTLLNSDGGDVIMQSDDGQVKIIKSASLVTVEFPSLPEGLISKPTLMWLIQSDKAGAHTSEISYLTQGMSWHAEYVAVTDAKDTQVELSGWVSIQNNAGVTFNDAKIKLVAGDVHTVRPERRLAKAPEAMMLAADMSQFQEKEFFEYHLYTLQRPSTVKDRQIKQLSLFSPATVKSEKQYVFDAQARDAKVGVYLEFKNSASDGLGMPLPAGKVRVYKEDEDKSQEFIGEDRIDHTPKDEKVRLYLGNAFDLVGERTEKSVQQVTDRSRRMTVEIRLRNHKKEDVNISVVEHFYGDWEFIGPTPPIKKRDASSAEFVVAVPKDGEKVFEYTVLYKW